MKQQLGAGLKGITGYKNSVNCCCDESDCTRFKHAYMGLRKVLHCNAKIKKRIPSGTRF
jgi:hypothetical protein